MLWGAKDCQVLTPGWLYAKQMLLSLDYLFWPLSWIDFVDHHVDCAGMGSVHMPICLVGGLSAPEDGFPGA